MSNFTSYPRQDQYDSSLSADIGAADVLLPVSSVPSFSMTTGGTNTFYAVIDYDSVANFEIVECDGISGSNINVKTGGRGKPKYSGGASTAKSHAAGAKIMITDTWKTWEDIATAINSKFNSAGGTISGSIDFSGATTTLKLPNLTTAERNALATPANGMKIYNTTDGAEQSYIAGSWVTLDVGTPTSNASETVAGKVEVATVAEVVAGTRTGGTGAILSTPPDALVGLIVPTGSISQFAGSAVPTGYLLCDGGAVSRATYSALFAVIGSAYGAGDGSTTFNVPDFRGKAAYGLNSSGTYDALAKTGGANTVDISHTHSGNSLKVPLWSADSTHLNLLGDLNTDSISVYDNTIIGGVTVTGGAGGSVTPSRAGKVIGNTGSGGSTITSITTPYLVVNYIIKT
jgi:microcystin-dependent protein